MDMNSSHTHRIAAGGIVQPIGLCKHMHDVHVEHELWPPSITVAFTQREITRQTVTPISWPWQVAHAEAGSNSIKGVP
jgi:hypothetical protein